MATSYWFFRRRKELKLNQEKLAARLRDAGFEVSRTTISGWETGRHNPPLHDADFRKALAEALELQTAELLRMAGYEVDDGYTENDISNPPISHEFNDPLYDEKSYRLYMESTRIAPASVRRADVLYIVAQLILNPKVNVVVNATTISDLSFLLSVGDPLDVLAVKIHIDIEE